MQSSHPGSAAPEVNLFGSILRHNAQREGNLEPRSGTSRSVHNSSETGFIPGQSDSEGWLNGAAVPLSSQCPFLGPSGIPFPAYPAFQ
jgi:hypothetical protein